MRFYVLSKFWVCESCSNFTFRPWSTSTPLTLSHLVLSNTIVIQAEDTYEQSTTDPEVKSTTSVSKSPSSTTCSSSVECTEVAQGTGKELCIELSKGSDSAISQDETYQDLIADEFVLDFEQRIIKENLFIEHEVGEGRGAGTGGILGFHVTS